MDETLYTFWLVLLGASVNSSILGLIVGVVANVDEEEHEQASIHQNASSFMAEHGLPSVLQQRVHHFLQVDYERGTARERAIFRQLPPPLQLDAARELRLELLSKSELAKVVPPSALARLTLEMTEIVVPPGELLLLEGDVCSTNMYIVVEGQFEILFTRSMPCAPCSPPVTCAPTAMMTPPAALGATPSLMPAAAPSASTSSSWSCNPPSAAAPSMAPDVRPPPPIDDDGDAQPTASAASALVDYAAYKKPQRQNSAQKNHVHVVATLGRGATLGAASFLLDDVSPSATVRATRRSYVLQLERTKLEGLLWRRGLAKDKNHLARMNKQLRNIHKDYWELNQDHDAKDVQRQMRASSEPRSALYSTRSVPSRATGMSSERRTSLSIVADEVEVRSTIRADALSVVATLTRHLLLAGAARRSRPAVRPARHQAGGG
eukprot:243299-Prymnesium_polylepis.2